MRKLVLASFTFKTGEIHFGEHRLVAVDFEITEEKLPVIVRRVQEWFNSAYPESVWIGGTVLPTLEIYGLVDKKPSFDLGVTGQLLEWLSRQHPEYIDDWYSGKISHEEVLNKFNKID